MKKFVAMLLALVMVFALCACGSNGDKAADDNNGDYHLVLKLSHVFQPNEQLTIEMQQVAQRIKERTNGAIEIQCYDSGQLATYKDNVEQVVNGADWIACEDPSYLADYDIYVSTSLGNTQQETIDAEVRVIMVYVAVIIVIVLLLTSQTYAEVPVLILTFVVGMILNMGTNFMLGTISFVSNSVTNILQLALSLDYAIIFCNHFKEEHQTMPLKEAVIESLSKSIPEISSSSLTTVGGLVAMLFMQFRIGSDMAVCLIKSILFAMLSVFVVMPGLLMLFGPYMSKTKHRNFVPKISFVGRYASVSYTHLTLPTKA